MDKNSKTLLSVLVIVAAMIGLAFASVPLYKKFCQVTGFGGTTQISDVAPNESDVLDREMAIHFSGNTNRNINWRFKPETNKLSLKVGQQGLISFQAKNLEATPATGTAIYNVTPQKAGKYFHKIQCFCFDAQTLNPGETMNMPVVFYVDPSIMNDKNMDDVKTITLSYSFFKSESKELDSALEEFYNAE